jgi:anti-sigma-K factor RskA
VDIKAYISSGIIEAYVLGLASNDEVREIEMYAAQYAEVKEAITDFEVALEKQAIQDAIQPPAFLKEKILNAIVAEDNNKKKSLLVPTLTGDETTGTPTKVVSLTAAPKSVRWLRGAVAASVILFLGSAILNFYYYSRYKEYYAQYKKTNDDYNALLAERSNLVARNNAFQASFNTINDTAVVKVTMQAASPQRTGLVATVYWNKQSKDVYLLVNNLPKPAAGKQYQLWAIDIVNGQLSPVDAGVVQSTDQSANLLQMKRSLKAQKFAITLENEGGSPTPTLSELQVIGDI